MQSLSSLPSRCGGRRVAAGIGLLALACLSGCASTTSPSKSTDNTLSGLTVSAGTLSPAFSTTIYAYSVSVANATASITVTAMTSSNKATIQVRGVAATSGAPSITQALGVGPNLIDVAVYAEDGSVRVYDITVTRAS